MSKSTSLEDHETLCDERWKGMKFRVLRLELIAVGGFSTIFYMLWEITKILLQLQIGG